MKRRIIALLALASTFGAQAAVEPGVKLTPDEALGPSYILRLPQTWHSAAGLFGADFVSLSALTGLSSAGMLTVKTFRKPPNQAAPAGVRFPSSDPQKFLEEQSISSARTLRRGFFKIVERDPRRAALETNPRAAFLEATYHENGVAFREVDLLQTVSADEYIIVSFRAPDVLYPTLRPLALTALRSFRLRR